MEEQIIVTLTTWSKRIGNIPVVLDTIFAQTMPPDKVVLNLAYEEKIPDEIQCYIDSHGVEVFRTEDTKVYKKLIPTLFRYPNDCIISIDDDWLYPKGMIEDFMTIHRQYPKYPISGNRGVAFGLQCHCGCASLTKYEYFGNLLDSIDSDIIRNCKSDDIVYTYFANKSGHPYIRTKGQYYTNMISYNNNEGYSASFDNDLYMINQSFNYLISRFGQVKDLLDAYIDDTYMAAFFNDLCKLNCEKRVKEQCELKLKSSLSYRLGHIILTPFRFIRYRVLKFS